MVINLRNEVVKVARSREQKNQYTQGSKRTLVGQGWSDCSSFVRWCYLQALGQDIGGNTVAQIVNKKLIIADESGKSAPKESNLLPGDLLYFKGTDNSRPFGVGHVELYLGNGKLIGHGSGSGPTIKDMPSYCASRAKSGKGYIRSLRVIPAESEQAVIPADPMQSAPTSSTVQNGDICITGAKVNIRTGPSTSYDVARIAKSGEIYASINTAGWRPILLYGEVCWVSETLSEEVS